MDSQYITEKTREANEGIRQVLEKFKQDTGLCIAEINISLIDAGGKNSNDFMIGQIKLKLIA